jgi:hypothetical protein
MKKAFVIFTLILLTASFTAPVTARPLYDTYSSQPDGAAGMDTLGTSEHPDMNFGNETYLFVQESSGQTDITSLLKFNLSSIPANATINSATLTLTVQANASYLVDDTVSIHRVKQNWTEDGATWNTYDGSNLWNTPGGLGASDIDATALATLAFTGISADTAEDFTLNTTEIQKLVDGTNPNYGFLVNCSSAENFSGWSFYSSDNNVSAYRPNLVIDYSLPTQDQTTPAISNSMTYGDIANIAVNLLIISVLTLAFIFHVVTTIIMRKRG